MQPFIVGPDGRPLEIPKPPSDSPELKPLTLDQVAAAEARKWSTNTKQEK
jgi:hypothetical protein